MRDKLSPERLPALELTAQPVVEFGMEASLQLLDWSSLLAGPKLFQADLGEAWSPRAFLVMPDPAAQAGGLDGLLKLLTSWLDDVLTCSPSGNGRSLMLCCNNGIWLAAEQPRGWSQSSSSVVPSGASSGVGHRRIGHPGQR